jgi:zinc transporter 1/2/3
MTDFDHYTFKTLAFGLIFVVGLAGGLLAFRSQGSSRGEAVFSLGSAFAAGIFLGAGLVHLLPDSIEALASYLAHIEFPVGYLLAAVGFVAILYLEKIALGRRHDFDEASAQSGASAYALVVILSVHSVLAGAALGSEVTGSGFMVIFLAIIAHKGAAGFALAVNAQRAGMPRPKVIRILILFASMTPIGIALGASIHFLLQASYERLFEGIFDALAAGTFLYVAIIEIIGKEFTDRSAILAKFVALCVGLGVMALIACGSKR